MRRFCQTGRFHTLEDSPRFVATRIGPTDIGFGEKLTAYVIQFKLKDGPGGSNRNGSNKG
jgi:hypothetical protein